MATLRLELVESRKGHKITNLKTEISVFKAVSRYIILSSWHNIYDFIWFLEITSVKSLWKNGLDLNFDLLLKELPQSEQKEYRTASELLAHREKAGISAETRFAACY